MFGVAPCQAASYCKLNSNFHGSCIGELNNGGALCTTQDGTALHLLPVKPPVDGCGIANEVAHAEGRAFYAGNIWIKRTDAGAKACEYFILNNPGPVAPGYTSSGPVFAWWFLLCMLQSSTYILSFCLVQDI